VLIGHSQGSFVLDKLVKDELDKRASERKRLVSALLIGGNIQVPINRKVGGDFKHVPACTSGRQNGCVVAYSTFDTVPPADALFGRVPGSTTRQVLCVNPASLSGDHGKLRSYFTTVAEPGPLSAGHYAAVQGGHPVGVRARPLYGHLHEPGRGQLAPDQPHGG